MRKTIVATLLISLGALQAVQASEPAQEPQKSTEQSAEKPADKPAAAPKTLEQKIADAKKAGYRIVDREGTTMYCRTRLKTGSRVVKETECLTEAELEYLGDASRRGLADMARQAPPPQGK
jgi:hypothetical protein